MKALLPRPPRNLNSRKKRWGPRHGDRPRHHGKLERLCQMCGWNRKRENEPLALQRKEHGMGWWRETIDVRKWLSSTYLAGSPFDLSWRQSVSCSPCFYFLWNHGFELLARMHDQFWRFGPRSKSIRCDHCFGCLYRSWSRPRYWNSHCWKGTLCSTITEGDPWEQGRR